MSFSWFVARRYLVARRRQALLSLISAVSILGVTVGVMALIVALALMTGVQSELRDRIVGATAHLQVYKLGGATDAASEVAQLSREPGVTGVAPVILSTCLMASTRVSWQPVTLKGVDAALESDVTGIREAMRTGAIEALADTGSHLDGVILGIEVARRFGVEVGDTVQVFVPVFRQTPLGLRPRLQRVLRVVGTFELGFYEFDAGYAFVKLSTAEEMLDKDGPDYMQVRLADLDAAPRIRERLQDRLGAGYLVQDWTQLNKALYSALALEKVAISLTIGLIVIVAALNIVASLVLLVMEKTPDIAILRTMGASAAAIRRVFLYQGLAIGLIGTFCGTALGLVVSFVADRYQLIRLDPDVYQIAYLPFRVLVADVAIVVAAAIVVCYGATIYPSRQAGRLDPAEALRNL